VEILKEKSLSAGSKFGQVDEGVLNPPPIRPEKLFAFYYTVENKS